MQTIPKTPKNHNQITISILPRKLSSLRSCHDRLNIMEISGYSIIHSHVGIILRMSYNPFVPTFSSFSLSLRSQKETFGSIFLLCRCHHTHIFQIMIEGIFLFVPARWNNEEVYPPKIFLLGPQRKHPPSKYWTEIKFPLLFLERKTNFLSPSLRGKVSFCMPLKSWCEIYSSSSFTERVMRRESFLRSFIKFESCTKANFVKILLFRENLDWWDFKKFLILCTKNRRLSNFVEDLEGISIKIGKFSVNLCKFSGDDSGDTRPGR